MSEIVKFPNREGKPVEMLEVEQRNEFIQEVGKITAMWLSDIAETADRYHLDRNNTMEYFAQTFWNMTEIISITNFMSDSKKEE